MGATGNKRVYDMTGEVFGTVVVGQYLGKDKYECKCSVCGLEKVIIGYHLRNGRIKVCTNCKNLNKKTGVIKERAKNAKIDMVGKHFGEWEVLRESSERYAGQKLWECRCSCGAIKLVGGYELRCGNSKSCGHTINRGIKASNVIKELHENQIIGKLRVLERLDRVENGQRIWKCRCICGKDIGVAEIALVKGLVKTCGHSTESMSLNDTAYRTEKAMRMPNFQDLTGIKFNELTAIKYINTNDKQGSMWECRCSCGKIVNVRAKDLKRGNTKSCGHIKGQSQMFDMKGKIIGEWTVIDIAKDELGAIRRNRNGALLWNCRCSCGKEKLMSSSYLNSGETKSCGHSTTGFKDITGMQFNNWNVLHIDNSKPGYFICECKCGTRRSVSSKALRYGFSKSCGCARETVATKIASSKYREEYKMMLEQLNVGMSKEHLTEIIKTKFNGVKPTIRQVAEVTEISYADVSTLVALYRLESLISFSTSGRSQCEIEIQNEFPGASVGDRGVLSGMELDMLFKEEKVAIEFNGTYWHSSLKQESTYHQNKTLKCLQNGIELIHVFEYEWLDVEKRKVVINCIKNRLKRKTKVNNAAIKYIDSKEAMRYIKENTLKDIVYIDVAVGAYVGSELVGVAAFVEAKEECEPQFNMVYLGCREYSNCGSQMVNWFIQSRKVVELAAVCDLTRESLNEYLDAGFYISEVTDPDYKWVNNNNNKTYSRKQSSIDRLIETGLASTNDNEDRVLYSMGLYKVYDSGYAVLMYER